MIDRGCATSSRSKKWTSDCAWRYLRASWMPTSGLTWAEMLFTSTLGCQRRQKATPERLPEVGLSLVQWASLHSAGVAPVNGAFTLALLAKLWCTVGPADRLYGTTAGFWYLLAGRLRKCKVRHLATMICAPSNKVHACRGSKGHHRDSCIPTITIITYCLQTPNICIDNKTKADIPFLVVQVGQAVSMFAIHMRAHDRN